MHYFFSVLYIPWKTELMGIGRLTYEEKQEIIIYKIDGDIFDVIKVTPSQKRSIDYQQDSL